VAMIVLIAVLLIWRIIKDRRSGFPSGDERTQKITGKAATYAINIDGYFTIALLAVNIINQEFYGSPAFEAGYALIASLLVYSLSFLGLRMYFDRKGDL
jgi:uncharacterized membrane protein